MGKRAQPIHEIERGEKNVALLVALLTTNTTTS